MTVLDANNILFEWIREHDSFEFNRDLKQAILIIDNEEETNVALGLALEELKEGGLISSKEYGDKEYHILVKPFSAYNQTPEISPWVASYIASEVNHFCELIEDDTDLCVEASLNEKDIKNLCHIIGYWREQAIGKEGDTSDKKTKKK